MPDPGGLRRRGASAAPPSGRWSTWASRPGTPLRDIAVDTVFVGSCTNGRIEDLRAAAEVLRGRKVADGVRMLVVPGSARVRRQAEAEGLDEVFTAAGAEWRSAGCSMCLGMNPDKLAPGERSASTSNRNFEGRQGKGGRTHLVSPAGRRRDRGDRPLGRSADSTCETEGGTVMEKFTVHTGTALPLRRTNVDTDQIIPAVYLKRVTRTGYEDGLFAEPGAPTPTSCSTDPSTPAPRSWSPAPTSARVPRASTRSGRLQDDGFRVVVCLALRRHLPRQHREDRPADGSGHFRTSSSACGDRRGRASGAGHRRPEAREFGAATSGRRSRSTTTLAGGSSRASTTSV